MVKEETMQEIEALGMSVGFGRTDLRGLNICREVFAVGQVDQVDSWARHAVPLRALAPRPSPHPLAFHSQSLYTEYNTCNPSPGNRSQRKDLS